MVDNTNIFQEVHYNADAFLELHPESRELTYEELKCIQALFDTASLYRFGDSVTMGPSLRSPVDGIFKTDDSWIIWFTNEDNKIFNPKQFDNVKDACIELAKRNGDKDYNSGKVNYFNALYRRNHTKYELEDFADRFNYTVRKPKELTKKSISK